MMTKNNLETIVFGGGCFWCVEAVFTRIAGVKSVISGYAGGKMKSPDYKSVCSGDTGHAEVIKIEFNPKEISLDGLLKIFFVAHDPTTLNRQGNDAGTQYRSVIFYSSKEQKKVISGFIAMTQGEFKNKIVTEVAALKDFYPAESYHHKYYDNNLSAPYCQFVIAPKLLRVKEKFNLG